jgi:hypothetical protein
MVQVGQQVGQATGLPGVGVVVRARHRGTDRDEIAAQVAPIWRVNPVSWCLPLNRSLRCRQSQVGIRVPSTRTVLVLAT